MKAFQTQKENEINGRLQENSDAGISGKAFTVLLVCMLAASVLLSLVMTAAKVEEPYPNWFLYVQYLFSAAASVGVIVWYFVRSKKSLLAVVKKQRCAPKYYLLAITLQIGLLSLAELNTLFMELLQKLGLSVVEPTIPSLDGFGFVGALLTIAVLMVLVEEMVFRGILLDGAKVFGTAGAALLCGGLFALYHQNPVQTIYQFVCGVAFALVAIRARSILPTVLSHFINNALVLTLTKYDVQILPTPVYITMLCISIPCLVGSLVYVIFLDKGEKKEKKTGTKKEFLFGALIGIALCAVTWISALFI